MCLWKNVASIIHKFDVRQRKFGKKWHVYDFTSNSTVYESPRKGACVKWIQNHVDLFSLASTHDWGMRRLCPTCEILKPLARWRLNHDTPASNWRKRCEDCDAKRRSKRK